MQTSKKLHFVHVGKFFGLERNLDIYSAKVRMTRTLNIRNLSKNVTFYAQQYEKKTTKFIFGKLSAFTLLTYILNIIQTVFQRESIIEFYI